MKISTILVTFLFIVHNVYGLSSIWESFELSNSKTFYSILNEAKYYSIQSFLKDTSHNYTLFLPTEAALQTAIKNNLFSNSTTTDEQIFLYMVLPNVYSTAFLGERRRYLNTLSSVYPTIITSPVVVNTTINFKVISGPITANIINQTQYANGIIYTVDTFLFAPLNAMDTISYMPELEHLENIIKSQNLSNIINVTNSTIFAPINTAWNNTSNTLAYGTIVHSLKYHIINQRYFQQDLLENNYTLTTNYLSNSIQTKSFANQTIFLIGGNSIHSGVVVTIVRADILTSSGTVIHLVNKLLPADSTTSEIAIIHNKFKTPSLLNNASKNRSSSFPIILLITIILFM